MNGEEEKAMKTMLRVKRVSEAKRKEGLSIRYGPNKPDEPQFVCHRKKRFDGNISNLFNPLLKVKL